MTDFSPDAVQAHLAAELSRAERQIDDAEKAMLHATICFGAARATIANVRAALAQPQTPFRKLAVVGGVKNRVRCIECGHIWESRLPNGQLPKTCGICMHPPPANGESLIVVDGLHYDLVQESGRSSTAGSYADASDEPIEPWMETTK